MIYVFFPLLFSVFPPYVRGYSRHMMSLSQVFIEDLVPARSHVSLVRSIGSDDPCLRHLEVLGEFLLPRSWLNNRALQVNTS